MILPLQVAGLSPYIYQYFIYYHVALVMKCLCMWKKLCNLIAFLESFYLLMQFLFFLFQFHLIGELGSSG